MSRRRGRVNAQIVVLQKGSNGVQGDQGRLKLFSHKIHARSGTVAHMPQDQI